MWFEAREGCDYSRRHLIRLLSEKESISTQKGAREATYKDKDAFHLVGLWTLMRQMCSKIMVVEVCLSLYFLCHTLSTNLQYRGLSQIIIL